VPRRALVASADESDLLALNNVDHANLHSF